MLNKTFLKYLFVNSVLLNVLIVVKYCVLYKITKSFKMASDSIWDGKMNWSGSLLVGLSKIHYI